MKLRRFIYWKNKELEEFYVFKAKILEIENFNSVNIGGSYRFEAEYYIEYPLSKTSIKIRGGGFIYHNVISYLTTKPLKDAIVELMARPADLLNGGNWEIYLSVADAVKQNDIDEARLFINLNNIS